MIGDTTQVMQAMCDADFQNKVFENHRLKDRLKYLTLEWAQENTMWQPRSWVDACGQGDENP